MRRGELYRVRRPPGDAREGRVFLIVSRQDFVETRYSSVICIPVYSHPTGVSTEVAVGPLQGLKHDSFLRCDELTSVQRKSLTDFVGVADRQVFRAVARAMAEALDIRPEDIEDL